MAWVEVSSGWPCLGSLPEGQAPGPLTLSEEGTGLLASVQSPSGTEPLATRMRQRQATVWQVRSGGLQAVFKEPGWVVTLDLQGLNAALVLGQLRASGEGSDYRLWLSSDGGARWIERGALPFPSVAQVLVRSAQELWVLGAGVLSRSLDAGASWGPVAPLPHARRPHRERLVRWQGGVALGTDGLHLFREDTGWMEQGVPSAQVLDAQEPYVLLEEGGQSWVVRPGARERWSVAPDRRGLHVAPGSDGPRVISATRTPGQRADLRLHVARGPLLGPGVAMKGVAAQGAIAGQSWALTVDAMGVVRGQLNS